MPRNRLLSGLKLIRLCFSHARATEKCSEPLCLHASSPIIVYAVRIKSMVPGILYSVWIEPSNSALWPCGGLAFPITTQAYPDGLVWKDSLATYQNITWSYSRLLCLLYISSPPSICSYSTYLRYFPAFPMLPSQPQPLLLCSWPPLQASSFSCFLCLIRFDSSSLEPVCVGSVLLDLLASRFVGSGLSPTAGRPLASSPLQPLTLCALLSLSFPLVPPGLLVALPLQGNLFLVATLLTLTRWQ